jgi:hypothetical protein
MLGAAGDVAGRPDRRALGLMAWGDALRCLGTYGESVAILDEAGQDFPGQTSTPPYKPGPGARLRGLHAV